MNHHVVRKATDDPSERSLQAKIGVIIADVEIVGFSLMIYSDSVSSHVMSLWGDLGVR